MAGYIIALIASTALFLLNTAGSLFFGEMDFDVDMDGGGFLGGDVFSFKGLLHFLTGFLIDTDFNERSYSYFSVYRHWHRTCFYIRTVFFVQIHLCEIAAKHEIYR